jgi:hypothetical protein
MSEKMVKVLTDLWRKADDRAFKAELRILDLERDCMCHKLYRSWAESRRLKSHPLATARDEKK